MLGYHRSTFNGPGTPGGPGITTDVSYFIDNISVTQAVAPGAIPTLSQQALLILGLLLALGAGIVLRQRRRSA